MTFVDGDDLCSGCSRCCSRVEGLLVTADELERLPRLAPFVVDHDQGLWRLDMLDGCPYLGDDGWCTTFDNRPFDCSLFPAQIGGLHRAPGQGSVSVTWRFGGFECPSRKRFVRQPINPEQTAALRTWIARAYDAPEVTVVHDRSPDRVPQRIRRRLPPGVRRPLTGARRRLRTVLHR
ncbi:MAG: YkgJ family cysteine cluster protein [Acidimicrobiales bacterium]